ncbi:hypothetical protein V6N11_051735 [Hibiscus sabdariffa]|uniref:Uncharacterized protein n=1 Tax=Hibiscus sabdariffa TaxID=183260 RepID=A0ABR2U870_9ROSI
MRQVHIASSVIDSAVKGKSQGHVVPSTIASTLVSKELVASSSDMIIVDISLGLNVGVIASPLPLKPVAITPWPSALENERSVTDGSSKKFNVLAAPIEIVLSNPVPCIFLRRWLRMLLLALMVQDTTATKIVSFFTGMISTKDHGVVGADSSLVRELLSFTMPDDVADLLVGDVVDEEIKEGILTITSEENKGLVKESDIMRRVKMRTVRLTGGIASKMSTIFSMFKQNNILIVDYDL